MNMHKNARLTFLRRIELVHAVIETRQELRSVAARFGGYVVPRCASHNLQGHQSEIATRSVG